MSLKRKASNLSRGESSEMEVETVSSEYLDAPSSAGAVQKTIHPLLRPLSSYDILNEMSNDELTKRTMNPKSLITGFYGSRGERLRHIVHEGALRLSREALCLISKKDDASKKEFSVAEDVLKDKINKKKSKGSRKVKIYDLPALDSVVRPSLDVKARDSMKVTYVHGEAVPGDGTMNTPVIRSIASNRTVAIRFANAENEIQRIRGGGGEDAMEDSQVTTSLEKKLAPSNSQLDQPATTVEKEQVVQMDCRTDITNVKKPSALNLSEISDQLQCEEHSSNSISLTASTPTKASSTESGLVPHTIASVPTSMDLDDVLAAGQDSTSFSGKMNAESVSTSLPIHLSPEESTTVYCNESISLPRNIPQESDNSSFLTSAEEPPSKIPSQVPSASAEQANLSRALIEAVTNPSSDNISDPGNVHKSATLLYEADISLSEPSTSYTLMSLQAEKHGPVNVSDNDFVSTSDPAAVPGIPLAVNSVSQLNQSMPMASCYEQPTPSMKSSEIVAGSNPGQAGATERQLKRDNTALSNPFSPATPALPLENSSSSTLAQTGPSIAAAKVVAIAPVSADLPLSIETNSAVQQQVWPLKKRPALQWELQKPSSNDEVQIDIHSKMPKPIWFRMDLASDLEMTVLPEWFDGSSSHRSPESYIMTRNAIITMSQKLGHNRFITTSLVRRSIPGDAGSLIRLHTFLTTYALINEDAINDTAPTPSSFQQPQGITSIPAIQDPWSHEKLCDDLVASVAKQAKRRRIHIDDESIPVIDWNLVADSVGHGVLPSECEQHFLSMSLEHVSEKELEIESQSGHPITSDAASAEGIEIKEQKSDPIKNSQIFQTKVKQDFIRSLVDNCEAHMVSCVANAAFNCLDVRDKKKQIKKELSEAQESSVLALIFSKIADDARSEEDSVARLLSEVVELRMQKLENRMTLLDDVEGMLEAERVALELERRDLYTARCRHWFGGT
jgi:SWIRM domain/SWIRM-associated region 1